MLTDLEPRLGPTPAPMSLHGPSGPKTRLLGARHRTEAAFLFERHAHEHLSALSHASRGGQHKPARLLNSMLEMATRLTLLAGPHEAAPTRPHDDTRTLRLGALWSNARTGDSPSLLERAVSEIDATTLDAIIGWSHAHDPAEHRRVDDRAKGRILQVAATIDTLAPEHGIDLSRAAVRYVVAHRLAA